MHDVHFALLLEDEQADRVAQGESSCMRTLPRRGSRRLRVALMRARSQGMTVHVCTQYFLDLDDPAVRFSP